MDGWMDGGMEDWMDGWMNGWMDEWMDGWMGEWRNGWMNDDAKRLDEPCSKGFVLHKMTDPLLRIH